VVQVGGDPLGPGWVRICLHTSVHLGCPLPHFHPQVMAHVRGFIPSFYVISSLVNAYLFLLCGFFKDGFSYGRFVLTAGGLLVVPATAWTPAMRTLVREVAHSVFELLTRCSSGLDAGLSGVAAIEFNLLFGSLIGLTAGFVALCGGDVGHPAMLQAAQFLAFLSLPLGLPFVLSQSSVVVATVGCVLAALIALVQFRLAAARLELPPEVNSKIYDANYAKRRELRLKFLMGLGKLVPVCGLALCARADVYLGLGSEGGDALNPGYIAFLLTAVIFYEVFEFLLDVQGTDSGHLLEYNAAVNFLGSSKVGFTVTAVRFVLTLTLGLLFFCALVWAQGDWREETLLGLWICWVVLSPLSSFAVTGWAVWRSKFPAQTVGVNNSDERKSDHNSKAQRLLEDLESEDSSFDFHSNARLGQSESLTQGGSVSLTSASPRPDLPPSRSEQKLALASKRGVNPVDFLNSFKESSSSENTSATGLYSNGFVANSFSQVVQSNFAKTHVAEVKKDSEKDSMRAVPARGHTAGRGVSPVRLPTAPLLSRMRVDSKETKALMTPVDPLFAREAKEVRPLPLSYLNKTVDNGEYTELNVMSRGNTENAGTEGEGIDFVTLPDGPAQAASEVVPDLYQAGMSLNRFFAQKTKGISIN
jgi:hypothetical protein